VHKPTHGEIFFEGKPMQFADPRDAIDGRDRNSAISIWR
jgi:ABC-type uncharacterized transport system ATPase subunit